MSRGADAADAALRRRIADPGWTPAARDLPRLLELLALADDDEAPPIVRALLRRADEAGPLALAALSTDRPGARVRLLRLLGRLITSGAGPAGVVEAAVAALADPDGGVRRQASRALGGLRPAPPEAVAAVAALLQVEVRADVRRAAIEALGKLGGAEATAALEAAAVDAPATEARLDRARLAAARAAHRDVASEVDLAAAPPAPLEVVLHCRRGLAPLLADELAAHRPQVVDLARVRLRWSGGLAALAASRLSLRIGLPLEPPARAPADVVGAVTATLTAPPVRALLATLTRGSIRYRLSWDDGAHHRAQTFAIAGAVAALAPELINDPSDATWQVRIGPSFAARIGHVPSVELEPRRFPDARFGHRVRDVPAASHPTLAAALARLAVRHARSAAADVVWDPFVGSGQELIERWFAGPVAALHGTDIDDRALAATAANLAAADVVATLSMADATAHRVAGLTCIITNPPMGRRVARGHARELLGRFIEHAADVLAPAGLLVWISPFPDDTRAHAATAGFVLRDAHRVDLGGFDGEIQVLERVPPTGREQRDQDGARPELTRSRRRSPPRR